MTIGEPRSLSSLPEELTEMILARVSRWKYPMLSLVSKTFHSLLSSMEIYKRRSQLGTMETCVYVCLQSPNHPCPSWFGLWTKPNQTSTTKQRGKIRFKQNSGPITFSSNSPPISYGGVFAIGSEIYVIGGPYNEPSSSVRILDCRSHTWRDSLNMSVAREEACMEIFDEKLYVLGGCDYSENNWFEVFDIKTHSWTALPRPTAEELFRDDIIDIIGVLEGKLYVAFEEKDYNYEPKDGTWKVVGEHSNFLSVALWCEIQNVMYCFTDNGYLMWSVSYGREWREIKGLEKLHEHPTRGLKSNAGSVFQLVNYGGNLLVIWDPYPSGRSSGNKLWFAKILLKSRCNGREVWGEVEYVDVITFPGESYEFLFCLNVDV